MPGRMRKVYKTKQSFRSGGSGGVAYSDVTVYDYAHVDKPVAGCVRLKKGATVISQSQAKMLAIPQKAEGDLDWFEKDLDDFEIAEVDKGLEENGTADQSGLELTGNIKTVKTSKCSTQKAGNVYPLDIWYILSNYIQPEEISTFARLCHSAYTVVHSAHFWRQLYHRFFRVDISLPEALGPACVERCQGLRARVIQALYYLYPPFVSTCKLSRVFHDEPHQLEGKRCERCWYHHVSDNIWRFNFQLRTEGLGKRRLCYSNNGCVDLMNGYDDVFYNPLEGCCVLQVSCQNFMTHPMVMGLILTKVYLNVSQDMKHHKLRLVFDSQINAAQKGTLIGTQLVLDPVLNVRVFHWWDPQYHLVK